MRTTIVAAIIAVAAASHVTAQTPEATSLFGKPLISAPPAGETKARLEADLAKAHADFDQDPSSAAAAIWLGRRLAYLGRFRDAIDTYSARHDEQVSGVLRVDLPVPSE
jgi:hypothetical protein